MGVIRIGSLGVGNDVGRLEPIPEGEAYEGSYKVSVGGLGAVNSEGHYFPATKEILAVFDSSSTLQRNINKNTLKGEAEHPVKLPGESKASFAQRFMSVSTKNVAFLIRGIEIGEPTRVENQPGLVHPIFLYIDPIGPYGEALRSDLENSNSNTYFSIRCLSKRGVSPSGQVTRSIYHVVTWDWVTEGGINFASKKNALAMSNLTTESYVEMEIDDLVHMIDGEGDDITTESCCNIPTTELLESINKSNKKSFSDVWNED